MSISPARGNGKRSLCAAVCACGIQLQNVLIRLSTQRALIGPYVQKRLGGLDFGVGEAPDNKCPKDIKLPENRYRVASFSDSGVDTPGGQDKVPLIRGAVRETTRSLRKPRTTIRPPRTKRSRHRNAEDPRWHGPVNTCCGACVYT